MTIKKVRLHEFSPDLLSEECKVLMRIILELIRRDELQEEEKRELSSELQALQQKEESKDRLLRVIN